MCADTNDTRLDMIYLGLTRIERGKKGHLWVVAKEAGGTSYKDLTAVAKVYAKPLQRGASPGSVYAMDAEIKEDGALSVVINSGLYKGRFEDADTVAQLQAQHHAQRVAWEAKSKAARERKERLDLERLEPLRNAYWNLGPAQRSAFLAQVIGFVTSPSKGGRG